MKKYIKPALLVFTVLIFSVTNGCDAFESFPINIPFTVTFTAEGDNNGASGQGAGCLDTNSETYQDYKDKINSLTFVEAAYRTDSVKVNGQPSTNLLCDINVSVRIPGGSLLFSYDKAGINPSTYISTPLVLQLDQDELDAIRTYLSLFETNTSMCFQATYTLTNFTGGNPPYDVEVKGMVDFVLEAETEL